MESAHSLRRWLMAAMACLICGLATLAHAGERAQVDLSVGIDTMPAQFAPGGRGTFVLTVRNAGADAAGTIFPDEGPIVAYGNSFVVTRMQPPPFELFNALENDCFVDRWVSDMRPDGSVIVQFSYVLLGPILAGEFRTCTSDIAFDPTTTTDVSANWRVTSSNDNDTNPSNDRVDYTFVVATPVPPASVSAGSHVASLLLGLGLLLAAGVQRRSVSSWDARRRCVVGVRFRSPRPTVRERS
jgi:hypothetical protein